MDSQNLKSGNGLSETPSSGGSEIIALLSVLKNSLPDGGSPTSYNREKLKEIAYKLSIALETPGETMQRVAYYPLQTSIVRIANRLRIFHILTASNGPIKGQSLAQTVKADHLLLLRLLRYLVAMGAIGEAGVDTYVANNITKNLSVPNLEAGVNHTYDIVGTSVMALPAFLAKTNYQNPTDPSHCAFNDSFHTTDTLFEWLPKHPEDLREFNLCMTGQREGRANWLDFFPFKEQLTDGFQGDDDAVMLVDVGGALGHEVQAIKNRYPDLPGIFVLQDLPETVKQAATVPGMQAMAHDFFSTQPIKGARAYYLRNVLHDWPDAKCKTILSQLQTAMKEGYSKIILNELVLPDQGTNLLAAQRDITMMAVCGATERNEWQWRDLLDSAELKIAKIWTDTPEAESILEVVLK